MDKNTGRLLGGALLLWAIVNTAVSVVRYGVDNGMYWWFCNLAMAGIGLAIVARHRGWIAGFLAIASFTQTFWIFDNVWRVATGENLFGLVEFMYQPGNPMDEFLLSHYHFFIIPTGVVALLLVEERRRLPMWMLVATNAFIFGVSYFLFPPEQNVNCIHEPCAPSLEPWRGLLWSTLFPTIVCLGCWGVRTLIERGLDRWHPREQERRWVWRGYAAVVVASLLLTAFDYRIKAAVPSFACGAPYETADVRSRCRFTLEHDYDVLALTYEVENKLDKTQRCEPVLVYDGGRRSLGEALSIAPHEKQRHRALLPYPKRSVVVEVVAHCATAAAPLTRQPIPAGMPPASPGN